jgi:hypothetical protein
LGRRQGCQIFLGAIYQNGDNVTNGHNIYQTTIKQIKRPQIIRNGHERYQSYPFKGLPKCTKTGGFGLETNHLATLVGAWRGVSVTDKKIDKVLSFCRVTG